MNKTIYILILIFTLTFSASIAQHTITGQVTPKGDYELMLLYKTEGAFQYYKASTSIDEQGLFGFSLPENFETGSYRMVYNTQKNEYVNIIYNNEDISFVFDPLDLMNTIYFLDSKENTLFYDYIKQIGIKYNEIDSVQNLCYDNYGNKKLMKAYASKLAEADAFQAHFEEKSQGLIANSFIKAYKKSYSELPFGNKDDYFRQLKNTYLNTIDFQDESLRNSSFIIDRLNEYVFDLNEAIVKRNNKNLDTKMVDDALAKIEASKFKNDVIYSLTSSAFDPYSSKYDFLLNYIYNNFYTKLPETEKNKEFTEMVKAKTNVIVGKQAPNITLDETDLYSMNSNQTLVIFWSTTCSHCLKEIPEVYKMLKDSQDIQVVLIGLEESYSDWETVILDFPNWTHLRANGKWDNEYAKAYNIKSTPAYFLLNQKKTILAKPDKLKDVKVLFGK